MNIPTSRKIKLPISAKTARSTARLPVKLGESSSAGQALPVCGLCRKRDSRYTCPRCNVLYCSLDCFKSEQHAQCSEPFYRSSIQADIASDSQASSEEKLRMLQMLKRFEGSVEDMPDAAELDDADGPDGIDQDLMGKLGDIDLDEIDTNELFHLLPAQHRDRFIQLLKDPTSQEAKDLLQTLDDIDGPDEEGSPWWQQEDEDDAEAVDDVPGPVLIKEELLCSVNPPAGVGEKLIFNVIAVCIAYAHLVLSFHLHDLTSAPSAERTELRSEILRLTPFLGDIKSTTRYENLRQAWEAVWSNVGDELEIPPDATTLITLLESVQTLIHPPLLLSDAHPLTRALSDLHSLFSSPKEAAPRKLVFYVRSLESLGRERWLTLEHEMSEEIKRLKKELDVEEVAEPERASLRIL